LSQKIDHKQLAVELLARAKEERGNPANTLALIGIGNALPEIADQLENLWELHQLDTIGNSIPPDGFRRHEGVVAGGFSGGQSQSSAIGVSSCIWEPGWVAMLS
jgi:hypothetical protein